MFAYTWYHLLQEVVPFLANPRLNLDKPRVARVWEDWFPISCPFDIAKVTQNGFVLNYKAYPAQKTTSRNYEPTPNESSDRQ